MESIFPFGKGEKKMKEKYSYLSIIRKDNSILHKNKIKKKIAYNFNYDMDTFLKRNMNWKKKYIYIYKSHKYH